MSSLCPTLKFAFCLLAPYICELIFEHGKYYRYATENTFVKIPGVHISLHWTGQILNYNEFRIIHLKHEQLNA